MYCNDNFQTMVLRVVNNDSPSDNAVLVYIAILNYKPN